MCVLYPSLGVRCTIDSLWVECFARLVPFVKFFFIFSSIPSFECYKNVLTQRLIFRGAFSSFRGDHRRHTKPFRRLDTAS